MPTVDYSFLINRLRDALARPLPGLSAQLGMSPQPRPGAERIFDPLLDCRRAAVLVLFYPCDGDMCLVLTRRTERLESHSGQISFPGGSMDPGEDADRGGQARGAGRVGGAAQPRSRCLGNCRPCSSPPAASAFIPSSPGRRSPPLSLRAKKKWQRCSRCPCATCCCPPPGVRRCGTCAGARARALLCGRNAQGVGCDRHGALRIAWAAQRFGRRLLR